MSAQVEARVLDLVGRAMGRFSMLRPGDRVAVGVSGGKDSLCLLAALVAYRARAPFAYELVAVTVEQGKFTRAIDALDAQIRRLGVEWVVRDEPATLTLVREGVWHGCDVCSRHRRRALYHLAAELGCDVLALGHTADDCAEALLRNILFNGRIASLPPVATSRKGTLRLIRPLALVSEALTRAYATARGLETVGCVCGDKDSVRREIRDVLTTLKGRHPGVAESISAALGNVNPYMLFCEPGGPRHGPPPPRGSARPGVAGRASTSLAHVLRRFSIREETAMAKEPREQQKTDAGRVPEQGTGKLDQDLDRIVEKERERQERPDDPGAPLPPA